MTKQIPLQISVNKSLSFDNYCVGVNKPVVDQLRRIASRAPSRGDESSLLFLTGSQGTGKSHLAQAFCAEAESHGSSVFFLSMEELLAHVKETAAFDPHWFDAFTQADFVCIDDFDVYAGAGRAIVAELEEALFVLLNRIILDRKTTLLLTSSTPQAVLGVQLADLRSRLSLSITLALQSNSDEVLLEIMGLKATERGLILPSDVAQFLLKRMPRNAKSLVEAMQRLDEFSMATVRPLTVPMAKEALAL